MTKRIIKKKAKKYIKEAIKELGNFGSAYDNFLNEINYKEFLDYDEKIYLDEFQKIEKRIIKEVESRRYKWNI